MSASNGFFVQFVNCKRCNKAVMVFAGEEWDGNHERCKGVLKEEGQ